jgi:anti-sigma factor RsiW
MTCRELIDFLDDYLSDALSPDVRAAFDDHLAVCLDCSNYLESYKRTIRLGKAVFASLDDDVPPSVPEDLLKAILACNVPVRGQQE